MATEKAVAEEGAEGEEGAAKPKGKKGLIIIIIAVLVLGGGGAGAFFAFGGKHDEKGKKEAAHEEPKLPPRYITLDPPFVVNFEAEAAVRFLQITVGVMTRDPLIETAIKENDPRVRNDLLLLLGGQTYAGVSTTEGKEALRAKCLEAVRAIVKEDGKDPAKVEALYFTSFVMQ
ncbi:MAG TPA: flagellar basal body-associated FliL family protein [Steroidobacteraceae bacterium]|nr:flagellar basal body-associated FliL family protein [Steroidobacteraceae bacterium]